MNIYRLLTNTGQTFAFEIENIYICPIKIADIISTIDGVTSVRCRKPFTAEKEIHIKFLFHETEFIVWEPYGDSSRYWIGPADESELDIELLIKAFKNYQPSFVRRVIGDIITFKFKKYFMFF